MRGFAAGVIWGGAVGLFGLGLASQMAPLPNAAGKDVASPVAAKPVVPQAPEIAAVTVPAGSEFARRGPESAPILPHVMPTPASTPAPRVPAPQAPAVAPAPDVSLPEPSATTAAAAREPSLVAPVVGTVAPVSAIGSDTGGAKATLASPGLAPPTEDAFPARP